MNIQAMMKQAQAIQKEMMKAKDEIDSKTYTGTSSFDAMKQIDKETEQKLGKYTQGMPGLF